MATDCQTKFCHYKSRGQSCVAEQPHAVKYFGGVHAEVQDMFSRDSLDLHSLMAGAGSPDADDGDEEVLCTTSLSCARPTSKAVKGIVDRFGFAVATCPHIVPLRGSACDMPTPEQFVYHILQLM